MTEHQPHLYADEGDSDELSDFESVTVPDDDELFGKTLENLGSRFDQLALICKPPN